MSPRPPFEGSDGDKVEDDDDCYGIMVHFNLLILDIYRLQLLFFWGDCPCHSVLTVMGTRTIMQ